MVRLGDWTEKLITKRLRLNIATVEGESDPEVLEIYLHKAPRVQASWKAIGRGPPWVRW